MDFEKICMLFTMQEPYYGIILSSMERIPKPGFGTLGVGRSGNVFKLYYDPAFIEQFNTDTITSFLKHEVLHVAFNHFSLWENENVPYEIHRLRNIAEDMEINSYLDRSKIEKKAGGAFAEDLGWEKKAGTREYFRRLMQKAKEEAEKRSKGRRKKKISLDKILNKRQRKAWKLRKKKYSFSEIASKLNCTEAEAKELVREGRKLVLKKMNSYAV